MCASPAVQPTRCDRGRRGDDNAAAQWPEPRGGGGFVLGFGSAAQTFVAPSENLLKELRFFVALLVAGAGTDSVARDRTASFVNDLYADGMLLIRSQGSGRGSYSAFPNLDLRFVATFTEAAASDVSAPGSALLSSFALAALAVLRRQTRAAPASTLGARATT